MQLRSLTIDASGWVLNGPIGTCSIITVLFVLSRNDCYFILPIRNSLFTALHGMPARTSDEKGVRLSVRLSVRQSVKRVHCDKTEERYVQIFIPYETSFNLFF